MLVLLGLSLEAGFLGEQNSKTLRLSRDLGGYLDKPVLSFHAHPDVVNPEPPNSGRFPAVFEMPLIIGQQLFTLKKRRIPLARVHQEAGRRWKLEC